jgi:hypothetical protein
MTAFKVLFTFVLVFSFAFASITLEYPIKEHFDSKNATKVARYVGDSTILSGKLLGNIAPGQTVTLEFSRETGSNFLWDNFNVTVPPNWEKKETLSDKITVQITAPKDSIGLYDFNITATSSYEPGTIKTPEILPFQIFVSNTSYVFEFPSQFNAVIDYPNTLFFKIKSNSLAKDTIKFSISGFPTKWVKEVSTTIKPLDEKTLFFSIYPMEQKTFSVLFMATHESGLSETIPGEIIVSSTTFQTKLKAMAEGFSLIPVILQPFYSLLSLFGFI